MQQRPASLEMRRFDNDNAIKVTISPASELLLALASLSQAAEKYFLSLKIENINVSRHDQAIEILEKIANSVFFEIDISLGLALSLRRERRPPSRRRRSVNRRLPANTLEFPKSEYEPQPISLYWYARSAVEMPLLQFLAYYQSIEFFFPIYSQNDARRRIQNILKTPGFSPYRDADIIRLLGIIKSSVGKGFGDERSQLRATLQECLDPNTLRVFLTADEEIKEFFTSKGKALSQHKIPLANPEVDLRNDVSDRIYDIRCKIVHTKIGVNESEVELLLPFSKEAELLDYDIELIEYVARRVIIASSKEMIL